MVKQKTTTNNGVSFEEWPCLCGAASCKKTLAVVYGVTPGTLTLSIRERDRIIAQVYLDSDQVTMLAVELRQRVVDANA